MSFINWINKVDNFGFGFGFGFTTLNRPFSKMAAENSNELKLAKIKNVYQH